MNNIQIVALKQRQKTVLKHNGIAFERKTSESDSDYETRFTNLVRTTHSITFEKAEELIKDAIKVRDQSILASEEDACEYTDISEDDIALFTPWIHMYHSSTGEGSKLCIRTSLEHNTFTLMTIDSAKTDSFRNAINCSYLPLCEKLNEYLNTIGFKLNTEMIESQMVSILSIITYNYKLLLTTKKQTLGKHKDVDGKVVVKHINNYLSVVWPYISTNDSFRNSRKMAVISNSSDTYALSHHVTTTEFKRVPLRFFNEFENMLPTENREIWVETWRAFYAASFNEKYLGRQAIYLYDSVGKSGKTTLAKAWVRIIGSHICHTLNKVSASDKHEGAALEGKSMIFITDLFTPRIVSTDIFHNVTGNDLQLVRPMNKISYLGELTVKMIVMCGNKQLELDTSAYHELSRIVTFPLTAPKRDVSSVLNSEDVIAGYIDEHQTYLELCRKSYEKLVPYNSEITIHPSITQYIKDTSTDDDTIAREEYVRDYIVFDKDAVTPCSTLLESFTDKVRLSKYSSFAMNDFKKYLKNVYNISTSKTSIFKDIKSYKASGYVGIKIVNCEIADKMTKTLYNNMKSKYGLEHVQQQKKDSIQDKFNSKVKESVDATDESVADKVLPPALPHVITAKERIDGMWQDSNGVWHPIEDEIPTAAESGADEEDADYDAMFSKVGGSK